MGLINFLIEKDWRRLSGEWRKINPPNPLSKVLNEQALKDVLGQRLELAVVQGSYNIEAWCMSNKHMLDLNEKMEAYFDTPFVQDLKRVFPLEY